MTKALFILVAACLITPLAHAQTAETNSYANGGNAFRKLCSYVEYEGTLDLPNVKTKKAGWVCLPDGVGTFPSHMSCEAYCGPRYGGWN